jgi:predicted AAA+ superfamily ATPase
LTGNNQPLLKSQIVQSLAGRAAYLHQTPFDRQELAGFTSLPANTDEWLFKGFYPPLYDRPFDPADWFAQYVTTYLERDLSQLLQVKDLRAFHRFLRLCAGRTGQVLNLSDLGRDADVSHTTIKQWLSILEASDLVFFLPPWHDNFNKRLVKSPKLYFYDVGLAGYLLGISTPAQWQTHPLRGAFFETLVISDRVKRGLAAPRPPAWYFWSSPSGLEVDLIEQQGQELRAYEIKSSATFRPDQLKNLQAWGSLAGLANHQLCLLNDGVEILEHRGIAIKPWGGLTLTRMLKKWRLSPIFLMGCRSRAFANLALAKRCRPLYPDFALLAG